MKATNKIFAFAFSAIGLLALGGAIFEKATHHYGTAIACAVIVIVCLADNRDNKTPGVSGQ